MSRVLPAAVLMPEYESLLRQGAELPLVISGGSMLPFLRPGKDVVYLKAPEGKLRRGDIAFYRRADGSYVLHRVLRVGYASYWFLGDAQTRWEGPLPAERVFARVTAVRRGETLMQTKDPLWRVCSGLWLRAIPVRPYVMKVYRKLLYLNRNGDS